MKSKTQGRDQKERRRRESPSSDESSEEEPVQERSMPIYTQKPKSRDQPKFRDHPKSRVQPSNLQKVEHPKFDHDMKRDMANMIKDQIANNVAGILGLSESSDEENRKPKKNHGHEEKKKPKEMMIRTTTSAPTDFKIPQTAEDYEKLSREQKAFFMQRFSVMQPSRPVVCFFHLIFKFIAGFSYLFGGLFVTSTLACFLSSFISVFFDFWITKNISGRLLVGLRWWNGQELGDIQEDEDLWIFESFDCDFTFHTLDINVFWWGMFFSACFWILMSLGKVLSIDFLWGMLTLVAMLLNSTNLYAYYRCYRFHRQKISTMADAVVGAGAVNQGQKFLDVLF